jgi:hypothetical protein
VSTSIRKDRFRSKYAVLIDAENAQHCSIPAVMAKIKSLGGNPIVRRVYGDFTNPSLLPWKKLDCSLKPITAFSHVKGKGTSDAAMTTDAMEIFYTKPEIDGYALVTSDSDFTFLAQFLREEGKHVLGFGKATTPKPFISSCERFFNIKSLSTGVAAEMQESDVSSNDPQLFLEIEMLSMLQQAVDDSADPDGWAKLGAVGKRLRELRKGFLVREYGYKTLKRLFLYHETQFDIRTTMESCPFVRNRRVSSL